MKIRVGERVIGGDAACYLVAEVGTTCLGDIGMALDLVRVGAEAGVDAVKFQVIDPHQDSNQASSYPVVWHGKPGTANMREMFTRLEFARDEWERIARACDAAGVDFFATVDYVTGVDLLEDLGAPVHKIGAWDGTFRPLIERIGRTGKPMLADLGPTTREEIEELESWYLAAGGSSIIYLHDFHTDVEDEINLAAITWLRSRNEWPVGYSSPGHDHDLDFAALALGAKAIEKRLILRRDIEAFHAHESLEPDELASWCARIRHVEAALGSSEIRPSQKDREGAKKYYRSICTLRDVKAGECFSPENLHGKRPGTGLPTARLHEFWGKASARDIPADTLIVQEDAK